MWQNSKWDKTQKLKIWQNTKTQNMTIQNLKCNKTQKNIKCEKLWKLKTWQNSNVIKLKNSKCDTI